MQPAKEHDMKTTRPTELIVALDVPGADDAARVLAGLSSVDFYKVGLELFTSEGPRIITLLHEAGKRVFLDLKLHDIPRTVARAVTAAAAHGVDLLTVHASGGPAMLRAAAEAAAAVGPGARRPRLVAVTTLTSLDQEDLAALGIRRPLDDHTLALGRMAIDCGIDGLVCSPLETARFRETLGPQPLLVTPGIRPPGDDAGDQKRVATPREAARAGADFLVVGRSILNAPDPAAAARAMLDDMGPDK
jgi:orotidine-5'-phosphate decarboxylase